MKKFLWFIFIMGMIAFLGNVAYADNTPAIVIYENNVELNKPLKIKIADILPLRRDCYEKEKRNPTDIEKIWEDVMKIYKIDEKDVVILKIVMKDGVFHFIFTSSYNIKHGE